MSKHRTVVVPGSYDPITNGHVDVITRAAALFDEVVVAVVAHSVRKSATLFPLEERLEFIAIATGHLPGVRAEPFDTLVVEFARSVGAIAMVKGLRAISDFEYELEMNQLNRRQARRDRVGLHHGQPGVQLRLLERRQGARDIRRRHLRLRAPARRRAAAGRARARAKSVTGNLHARPARYPVAMDVLVLIDKLDDLVHNAKQVPLTDQVRVDKEEIYDLLDQMRATIPEEIKQARWIVKERQEMLAEAKREAERIVKEARERQDRLISSEEVMKAAERAAEDIIDEAQAREREIRLGAEDYADEILNTLEVNLSKFIAAVQRGRERLQGRDESAVA